MGVLTEEELLILPFLEVPLREKSRTRQLGLGRHDLTFAPKVYFGASVIQINAIEQTALIFSAPLPLPPPFFFEFIYKLDVWRGEAR